MEFTLHVGLEFDEDINVLQEDLEKGLAGSNVNMDRITGVFVDGDSFSEWGKVFENPEYLHGVINYTADDAIAAKQVGLDMVLNLLQWPDPVITLAANCSPHKTFHIPFAITRGDDWSTSV